MRLEDQFSGRNRMTALALAAVFAASGSAFAASSTWTQLDAGSASGSWNVPNNWQGSSIADGTGATADFNQVDITKDSTVTLDAPRTIGNITFGRGASTTAAGWILNAGTGSPAPALTLDGTTPTITVNALGAGKNARINAVIAGDDGLTKDGAGRLVLTATNIYSGTTTVSAGVLQIGADAGTGSVAGNISIGSGARVEVFRNNSFTPAGNIIGEGQLHKYNGAGTLTLNGNNTYSGGTTLFDGGILLGTGTNNGIGTGTITLKGGRIGSADDNSRTVANTLVLDGTTLTFGAASGAATGRGNLIFSDTSSGSLGGNRNIDVHNSTTVTLRKAFSSSNHSLTKRGTGTLILEGASLYTGGTNVNVGTLLVNNSAGSGTGSNAVSVAEGAILGGTGSIQGSVSFAADSADADALGAIFKPTAAADPLAIGGSLSLGAGSVLDLGNFSGLNPVSSYTILTYGGTQLTGGFTVVNPVATHNVSYAGDHSIQLVPVPEPTTLGVLGVVALVMTGRRRRN